MRAEPIRYATLATPIGTLSLGGYVDGTRRKRYPHAQESGSPPGRRVTLDP